MLMSMEKLSGLAPTYPTPICDNDLTDAWHSKMCQIL